MIPVHKTIISGNQVSIYVSSLSGKRMEIIISVSAGQVDNSFNSFTGTCGLSGLLEIKRVIPSIVSWIKAIGFIPVADPADTKRRKAFFPFMKRFGINLYQRGVNNEHRP